MKMSPQNLAPNKSDFYGSPISIDKLNHALLVETLNNMIHIRCVEALIGSLVKLGQAKCPCHLATGQEAVPVALSTFLKTTDRIFGAHRSHGHYLAQGGSTYALIAEILGKVTGCSKGMGGSMHIVAQDKGFMGSVPIVAGTVSLAVGAALAAKKDGRGDIAVAYFGDGACEEGVVHECLNIASVMELPILFVVENNLFSSHMDIHLRQPSSTVSRFATAHCMENYIIDGNDAADLLIQSKKIIEEIRKTSKPVFIEAMTYRWNGHVGANDDVDVGLNRSIDLLNLWKRHDPIRRLEEALLTNNAIHANHVMKETDRVNSVLNEILIEAQNAPYPDTSQLYHYIYSEK